MRILVLGFFNIIFCISCQSNSTSELSWDAQLTVRSTDSQTVGDNTFASSSTLDVSWTATTEDIDHYEITAIEQNGSHTVTVSLASTETQTDLTGLKAGSTYDVSLSACADSCSQPDSGGTASGAPSEEYWQLQGSDNSYTTATKVVTPSSSLAFAIRLGADSGAEGQTQFYYNPGGAPSWSGGARIAVNSDTGTDINALQSFSALDSGLKNACPEPNDGTSCYSDGTYNIQAFQAVPLKSSGTMRLFFEAQDISTSDKITRLYSLDSQDGYLGRDFNRSSESSICVGTTTTNDYRTGGDCEPTLVLGVNSDAEGGGSGLDNARQFKIGYPQREGWLWDDTGETPSFMMITGEDSCDVTSNGLFFAAWTGSMWDVEKSDDCATPLVTNGHGPVLVHLVDAQYKLYYEDETNGHSNKPLKLIFADGSNTGDVDVVDFADWESEASSREVHFLWPDGSLLTANEESGLGDHVILVPDDDLDVQIMYLNLGGFDNSDWSQASAGLGVAVFLNP